MSRQPLYQARYIAYREAPEHIDFAWEATQSEALSPRLKDALLARDMAEVGRIQTAMFEAHLWNRATDDVDAEQDRLEAMDSAMYAGLICGLMPCEITGDGS